MVKSRVLTPRHVGSRRENCLGGIGRIFREEALGEDEGVGPAPSVVEDIAGAGIPSPRAA